MLSFNLLYSIVLIDCLLSIMRTMTGVDPVTHLIDYDKLAQQALEVKPKIIIAGASSYSRAIGV